MRRQLPGDGTITLVEADTHQLDRQLADMVNRYADDLTVGSMTTHDVLERFVTPTDRTTPEQLRARQIIADSYRRNGSVFDQLDRLDAADAAAARGGDKPGPAARRLLEGLDVSEAVR